MLSSMLRYHGYIGFFVIAQRLIKRYSMKSMPSENRFYFSLQIEIVSFKIKKQSHFWTCFWYSI